MEYIKALQALVYADDRFVKKTQDLIISEVRTNGQTVNESFDYSECRTLPQLLSSADSEVLLFIADRNGLESLLSIMEDMDEGGVLPDDLLYHVELIRLLSL